MPCSHHMGTKMSSKKAKCSTCSKLGHFAKGSDNESISALWNTKNLLKEITISTEVYSYCNHIQQWSTNAKIIDAITFNVLQSNGVSIKPSNIKLYSHNSHKPIKASTIHRIYNIEAIFCITKAKTCGFLLSKER